MTRPFRASLAATLALSLAACSMAPHYRVPTPIPAAPGQPAPTLPGTFKAEAGFNATTAWVPATPADEVPKGEWWRLFNDPALDALEAKVTVTNQNVAAARAAYLQARALVAEDRAALFPTVGVSASATRNGTLAKSGPSPVNSFTAQAAASWAPDLWGKVGDTVRAAKASAEASAADLANATLSARAELASDYLQLRGLDAQIALQDDTIAAYTRVLTITRNKLAVGNAAPADVDSAEAQLDAEQASGKDLARQRAQLEDAVAVLAGENPSTFHIMATAWQPVMPDVPGVLPAQVLQRRPDIASAERSVAAANANSGIQRAAFFPVVSLTGSVGGASATIGQLFAASSSLWSLGASAAETVLDFGARSAKVSQARQQYNAAVATYRQTVLGAFQQVEDNLAALSTWRLAHADLAAAAAAAGRNEAVARNQYLAGTVDFTTLATQKATANTARQDLVANEVDRQSAAVALIAAIGGQWDAAPAEPTTAGPTTAGPTPTAQP